MRAGAIFLLAGLVAVASAAVSYDDYQVWRMNVETDSQLHALADLVPRAHEYGLSFWTEPRPNATCDVLLHPNEFSQFEFFLRRAGLDYDVMIDNVGSLINKSMEANENANADDWFAKYHNVEDTIVWYNALVKQYSNLASTIVVGKTYQGKDIVAVKVSSGGGGNRKAFWIDGGIHAREWIAPAVVQYILNSLLTQYGKDADITAAVDAVDWYIVPQYNIDGIEYTWNTDRMWRKTVSPNAGSRCIGTDPNRNWDFHWGEAGTSTDPCSEAYCGPSANSEVEVSSIAAFIAKTKNIHGYINFHAYSQLWMFPWAYQAGKDKDYDVQNDAAAQSASALQKVHGTKFVTGPIATTIYPASGSTVDYTYGTLGIKYSYGVELRDTGRYGFILPASQIIPSGEETLAAVLPLAKIIANDGTLERL